MAEARPEELDELADDLGLAEELGDGEGEVGGGDAFAEGAGEVDADDVGREEVDGLAEHAGLGFDAAHAPADDAEAVDHGGVGVGADEGVGVIHAVFLQHALGEVLEVHLVDDADAGRDDLERVERLHAPLEELVAFAIALELEVEIAAEGVGAPGEIDLDRVVDDEIDGNERFDELGVLAHARDRAAHGGEIDEQRHAGEVLQNDAGDDERDLRLAARVWPSSRTTPPSSARILARSAGLASRLAAAAASFAGEASFWRSSGMTGASARRLGMARCRTRMMRRAIW